ncbi:MULTISPECIES: succinylglutamate desuccinylase/aspartoacylase family protein [Maribacter]|uniref:Succinylglutamate desuccinylase/aspartoacylase family protein n=1 Tax=Maribacter flavus TaxID=1658664 RepID=A0ABU7IG30_9FLAO|nr:MULTISPECIES: succinylglutamate desuccinylase/aspartoacylase family protein [Maribacter]MDC6405287.1 succinylglutamate desuccinylase/aspartoacylase family protein [Maribacter sp. PR66]MEE1971904.1 succinylglutamate desuccinylase/aspartoacylase family protein [Maribacter flavus]
MVKVYSKALVQSIEINRILGRLEGDTAGPTIIFTAGIHGNEPSGVFALVKVLDDIKSKNIVVRGKIYAIAGNLSALQQGVRYNREDLNRMWNEERAEWLLKEDKIIKNEEDYEQYQLYTIISQILEIDNGPFYFVDLHTTSSPTKPFITVNDTLLNRKFTEQYPVPLLLGIEEYLEGTLLSYINQLGYVAFGFESGQHDAPSSIENHIAFVYLTLIYTGVILKVGVDYDTYYTILNRSTEDLNHAYEIVHHHKIGQDEDFYTKPGFSNFEQVKKGQQIATSNSVPVLTPLKGNIFMPLYQKKGEDGFFIIRHIPSIFLSLSSLLRKLQVDRMLAILPGVSWISDQKDALRVDLRVAKFLAKKFFHLMGYRSRRINENFLIVKNREAVSKNKEYRNTTWYRNSY